MKKVVIIGGGFAGLACAFRLKSLVKKQAVQVTLISDKDVFTFLPMLPDCLGRGVSALSLTFSIEKLSRRLGFNFIKDKVERLDLDGKKVVTKSADFAYDFLLVASGSETNFYGNNSMKAAAFKLDDAYDAALVRKAMGEKEYNSYIVVGGGYTGVEVATNMRIYLANKKIDKRVIIVERAPQILGPLPNWMRSYVLENLKKLNIELFTGISVNSYDSGTAALSSGEVLQNALLVWAAGVKTAGFIEQLSFEKNPQGRIKVDSYLRFSPDCFAAGDAAFFSINGNPLRMAVQFSIMQGDCVGRNIIRSIKFKKLNEYKPVDLGYIIPMANNKSCGIVLGLNLKGYLPTLLHYFMCLFRSYGFKNRVKIAKDLLIKGGE
jgi:NADH dehydrogenase